MSSARWPSPFIANLLNETCRAYIVRLLVPYPLSGYPPLRNRVPPSSLSILSPPLLLLPACCVEATAGQAAWQVRGRWNTGFNGIKTMIVTPSSPHTSSPRRGSGGKRRRRMASWNSPPAVASPTVQFQLL